jgi:membrane protein implicated in regulation of membrane protease activity
MSKDRSALIAAALILGGTFLLFVFMPRIMLAAGDVSPWLAGAVGLIAVGAFFAVFWLRARYKRTHED